MSSGQTSSSNSEALALELRAPDGTVIPTDPIYVRDTERLRAMDRESEEEEELSSDATPDEVLDPDDPAVVDDMLAEFENDHPAREQSAQEREPARCQLHVRLTDPWAIP